MQNIKTQYYRFQPGEFMPIYDGHDMLNKTAFHMYKLRTYKRTLYDLTHVTG